MFPSTTSRETLRLLGKQNSLFPSGADIKCILFFFVFALCFLCFFDRTNNGLAELLMKSGNPVHDIELQCLKDMRMVMPEKKIG